MTSVKIKSPSFSELYTLTQKRALTLQKEWKQVQSLIRQSTQLVANPAVLLSTEFKNKLQSSYPEIQNEIEALYTLELIQSGHLLQGLNRLKAQLKSLNSTDLYFFDFYAQLSQWMTSCKERKSALQEIEKDDFKTYQQKKKEWELKRLWIQKCDAKNLSHFDRTFIFKFPAHPLVRNKWKDLKLTAQELLEYALVLEVNQHYQLAQERLGDLNLHPSASQALKDRAFYEQQRIQVKRIRKETPQSKKALKKALLLPKEWGRKSRLLAAQVASRKGETKVSRQHYQYLIQEWPFSKEKQIASFFLAFNYYEQHQYRKAVKLFAPLTRHQGQKSELKKLKKRSNQPYQAQAEWYYAWSLFQNSPTLAAPFLENQIGPGLPLSEESRRSAYWASRAWAESQPKQAKKLRQQLIKGNEHDWYALLLRAQYPQEFKETHALSKSVLPPLKPSLHLAELKQQWVRFHLLSVLNQSEWIQRHQTQMSEQILTSKLLPNASIRLLWMKRFGLIKAGIRGALRLAPQRRFLIPKQEDYTWWSLLYPKLLHLQVEQIIKPDTVYPNEVLSFIRKESLFNPYALSPAHAMGLMQMMHRTQKKLFHYDPTLKEKLSLWLTSTSKELKEGQFTAPALLYNPQINLIFGSTYLEHLHTRYHNQLPLISIAYNAGPQNVQNWVNQALKHNIKALDLFVELVPFKEARTYVKRWTQTYCLYQSIYGIQGINQCALDLPLTLNLNVSEGINF